MSYPELNTGGKDSESADIAEVRSFLCAFKIAFKMHLVLVFCGCFSPLTCVCHYVYVSLDVCVCVLRKVINLN